MSVGGAIWSAVAKVGQWAIKNPGAVLNAADEVKRRIQGAKVEKEAPVITADGKIVQLGEAVVELDQKINRESQQLQEELETLQAQLQQALDTQKKLEDRMLAYQKKITVVTVILGVALLAAVALLFLV